MTIKERIRTALSKLVAPADETRARMARSMTVQASTEISLRQCRQVMAEIHAGGVVTVLKQARKNLLLVAARTNAGTVYFAVSPESLRQEFWWERISRQADRHHRRETTS